jgi:hypothetical protein
MSPVHLAQSLTQHIFLDIVKTTIAIVKASLFDWNTRLGATTPLHLTLNT